MCIGYMQTLCHFLEKTWASLNFGIHGDPGSNVPQMSACSVALSCLILCNPIDWSPPGSSVQGILQARILEWAATSSSGGPSQSSDGTCFSYILCISRWAVYHQRHLGSPFLIFQETNTTVLWTSRYSFDSSIHMFTLCINHYFRFRGISLKVLVAVSSFMELAF